MMPDATPALSRSYGQLLARPANEAAKRDERAQHLADELRHAWLTGADRVESVCGTQTLAEVLGERLGDADVMVVELVRRCALAGDPLALSIIAEVGKTFGQDVAYILADRGLLA